jgi:hypothetical protein
MTRALTALVALVLLVAPPAATAQEPLTNAPPGNSAIDEYLETVPGATGDQRPRQPGSTGGGAGSRDGGTILTAAQRAELERLGPDGKALADAVEATAPPREKPRATIDPGSVEGRSPIGAVFEAVTGQDGGGMGAALPIILVGSLLGVIALVLLRRRSVS